MAEHRAYRFQEEEYSTHFNGKTILRILGQIQRHWPWAVGAGVLIAVVAALDAYFTFLGKRMIDEGIISRDLETIYSLAFVYGGLIFVQGGGVFGFIYFIGSLGERIQYDLRQKMFSHLQDLSFSYFDRTPVGWIMSRVTSDSARVGELVSWGMLDITWGVVNISTAIGFMFLINWRLALVVLGIVPMLLITASLFKRKVLAAYRQVRRMNSEITGAYNESISGVRVVKALGREQANLIEFGELTRDMYQAGFRAALLSALFLPLVQLISAIAVGSIVWYGGLQAQLGNITIGGIQAFITYVAFMLWPIQEMARVYAEMQQSVASAERVFGLIDSVPEVADRPGSVDPGTIGGDLVFEHVDFYYDPSKPVLTDFTLRVKRGETVALVGPTGAGKSTVVNMICRFYEPRNGVIRIGGRDYTEFSMRAIQSRIGMVLQTPHLFSGTVRENIRYGRLDASNDEVERAAKVAGAHDYIVALEGGYEGEVGEGGILLSVGHKQLISLARAVLTQPEIFIMDEATSSVDTLTEALIQRGMEMLMTGRTTFVIAHRLSTIRRADRIVVMDHGRIVEMGSHADLIRARGPYYNQYTRQFRQEREMAYDPFQLSPIRVREVRDN